MTYLHEHPLVFVAMVFAVLLMWTLTLWGVASSGFLRRLRAEEPSFWVAHFRHHGVGLIHLLHVTPFIVAGMTEDPSVLSLCIRYQRAIRRWQVLSVVLFVITIAVMVAEGWADG